jgi:hypothetical protein
MISVAIEAKGDGEALSGTLSALVSAAAEGVLRDVVIAAAEAQPDMARLVDAFGGDLVSGDVQEAIRATRAPWVLVLNAGDELEPQWWREALHFMERAERSGRLTAVATFTPILSDRSWRAFWREIAIRLRPASGGSGLLAQKDTLLARPIPRPERLRTRLYKLP